ncbi:MAG: acyl-CoA reductase [Flavobacteriaceae bacterium]|nr:acyl-CoA reductase [Flavobacteriaceae bacterium]MDG1686079.1 acyl-CoA reductase [Flavobacteriaceae bacterium]MDG2235970.1 acyl-CoA reductase [Flavobacteriaceae bacterium]
MNPKSKRIDALISLGVHLGDFKNNHSNYSNLQDSIEKAIVNNAWFNQENIESTFRSWSKALNENQVKKWVSKYNFKDVKKPKTVALILAGNIPMVGFHDIVSVWVSGNNADIKCASKDKFLIPYMTDFLEKETGISAFKFTDQHFTDFDAVIATGSNNSARYFNHYFGKYPNIIRKNRNGIAILNGQETKSQMEGLATDIIQYYGLGCRNVSKVYIPNDYNINFIFGGLYRYSKVIENAKYANNYDYNKAVFLMSDYTFLENGFFIIREDKGFSAPIACLHYEYYSNEIELEEHLNENRESIQCIISNMPIKRKIDFGSSQQPSLWDYADELDTLSFLNNLH